MNELMKERMNEWMIKYEEKKCMNEWKKGRRKERIKERKNERMKWWMNERLKKWKNAWMNE